MRGWPPNEITGSVDLMLQSRVQALDEIDSHKTALTTSGSTSPTLIHQLPENCARAVWIEIFPPSITSRKLYIYELDI